MRVLISLGLLLSLASCSGLKAAPQRFTIEKRWVRNTLAQDYLGARRIHRFQPILNGQMVIAANSIDGIVAYNRKSGHQLWRFDIADGVEGGATLIDGRLFFGAGDGQFYCLKADTGQVLWTYPLKAEGLARPLVQDNVVYVLGGNNILHALDESNGKLKWLYNRREASNLSIRGGSQPALSGNLLFVGFSDGSLVALNRTSGAVIWEVNLNRNKRFRDVDASPILDGSNIYVSSYDGALYSLQQSDGKILWKVDDGGYERVLVRGGLLYFSTTSGKTEALDKGSGKIIWSRKNPKGIATGPEYLRGSIVIGEMSGALRFLDARTGALLGQFEPGRGVTSIATVDRAKGQVYFMSADANLYALKVKWERYTRSWPWE